MDASVTSAADILPIQPAARPDHAVRGRAAAEDTADTTFADLLDAESLDVEAADAITTSAGAEAAVVPAPVQPAAQPVVPASDSAAAILAGLTTEGGEKIDANGAETLPTLPEFSDADGAALTQPAAPAMAAETAPDAVPQIPATPVVAQPAESAIVAAAPAATTAAAPVAQAVIVQTQAIPAQARAVAAPALAATAQPQPTAETDESAEESSEVSADPAATSSDDAGAAKPAVTTPETSPIITTAAVTRPAVARPDVAPAPTIATPDAPSSAPGAERAAAEMPDAISPRQTNLATPNGAAQGENARVQRAANRAANAAASVADAAANISVDAAPSSTPSITTDITAPRTLATADAARPAPTHPALQNSPAATIQVYQRMIERVDGRAQRFEVRLDPAELGRVDVRIEVGADKKVHAVLAAHDSAALSDLMRGQRALERALTDAGIDLADGGVRFELSSDNGRGASNNQTQSDSGASPNVWRRFNTIDVPADQQTTNAVRGWRPSRLDLVA